VPAARPAGRAALIWVLLKLTTPSLWPPNETTGVPEDGCSARPVMVMEVRLELAAALTMSVCA
jgi:hypothetical protein